MKKKNLQNNNGITICDSIVMSVKRKRANIRRLEAVIIAVIGYVSAIMSFLNMFDFSFDKKAVVFSAVIFSVVYILLSFTGQKSWLVGISIIAVTVVAYIKLDTLILGFKYMYNVIYRTSMYRDIDYYKFLRPEFEESSVTTFFIFSAWFIAVVVYVFTIYHQNSLPPLLVTFPLIEIGLYNGIEISVFWGMLTVSYWLALFAMTTIDGGEYSGGNGGFVRKENLFFPKRQMKLKVTEKCGIYIIITVIAIAGISSAVLNITDYKRSEEINKKRIEIRDAVTSFSSEDLVGSISELTSAFGLTFKVQSHKLGNIDRLKYKETTDLVVTFDDKYNGAVYLKEYTGSVYDSNEWRQLPDSAYNNDIFDDFEKYNIYPQDFPYKFSQLVNAFNSNKTEYMIQIDSKLRKNRSFAPYGTDNIGGLEYDYDANVTSKSDDEYSYKFAKTEAEDIADKLKALNSNMSVSQYQLSELSGETWTDYLNNYVNEKNLLDENGYFSVESELISDYNAETILAELIENDYRDFVYENYLQLPYTDDIEQIRTEFADILGTARTDSADSCIQTLTALREKISSMAEYSLTPGRTPASRDFVNYFLLENHKGYCTHYATSGVVLARMAGIPARYATGYVLVGDDFTESAKNPDGTYTIELKDNRSHAWVEVYLNGYGWVPFEFTAGYSNQTIDTTPTTTATTTTETTSDGTETTTAESSSEQDNNTTTVDSSDTTEMTVPNTDTITVTNETTVAYFTEIPQGTSAGMSKALKYTIYGIITAVGAVLLVFLRRTAVLYIRKKHFTDGSRKSRMGYMYSYTEKLLKYLKIERENMQYTLFAEKVEKSLGKIYFSPDEFREFTDTALKSAFSEYPPNNDELKKCYDFTVKFAGEIYKKSNTIEKIYLKIILVFI